MSIRVELSRIQNSFVHTYSNYTHFTESPEIFHLWCGLSGISACLGRRVYTKLGAEQIFPNMYVVLVGPPGVRKSTAMSWTKRCLKSSTNVRWAPDDTSGQRQGLLRAFTETDEDETSVQFDMEKINAAGDLDQLQDLIEQAEFANRQPEKEVLYGIFGELDSLIGTNQRELLTFLRRVWDGDSYTYRLRSDEIKLTEPLMGFIAATTPEEICQSLPEGSLGSGFCSRLIFVFAEEKKTKLPNPPEPNRELQEEIENVYKRLFNQTEGEVKRTSQAEELLKTLYLNPKESIDDPRFIYYLQRRHTHVLKLSLSLAMARGSNVIADVDVQDADYILTRTELDMPLAMGEFGLSPLASAQQKVLDYVKHSSGVVKMTQVWSHMQRDLKSRDFEAAISNLKNAGKIKELQHKDHGAICVYQRPKWELDELHKQTMENDNVERFQPRSETASIEPRSSDTLATAAEDS